MSIFTPMAPAVATGLYLLHDVMPDPNLRATLRGKYDIQNYYDLINFNAAVQLNTENDRDWTNAKGIEHMRRATRFVANHGSWREGLIVSDLVSVDRIEITISSGDENGPRNLGSVGIISRLTNLQRFTAWRNGLTSIGRIDLLPNLERLEVRHNSLTSIGTIPSTTALNQIHLDDNAFSVSGLEALIDSMHERRVQLGANGCSIRLVGNPGSAGAAISRQSQIADLIAAGCTVSI